MGKVYLMACCLRCGAGQGDGAVDRLLTSLHPRVPVRVPIPPAPLILDRAYERNDVLTLAKTSCLSGT